MLCAQVRHFRTGTGTLTDPAFLEEERPRDFTARITREGRSRDVARPRNRRIVYRRMGVLAAALAVPAMAAPNIEQSPKPQVIRFVLPETIPYSPPEPVALAGTDEGTGFTASLASVAEAFDPGPAAPAFAMSGGLTTRLRAEHCLTMAIYYEAASEGEAGQRGVAQVVMNRVQHPGFPNSVCGVVFQGSQRITGCQFSFTCDGSLARRPQDSVWERAGRVAKAALGGFVFENVGLATHYHTLAVNPYWAASLDPVGTIGAHRFYRWNGSAGSRSAFSAQYDGFEQAPARHMEAVRQTPLVTSAADPVLPAGNALAPIAANASGPLQPAMPEAQSLQLPGAALDIHSASGQWLDQP